MKARNLGEVRRSPGQTSPLPSGQSALDFEWPASRRGQLARPEILFGCVARGEERPLAFEVAVVDPDTLTLELKVSADRRQAVEWQRMVSRFVYGGANSPVRADP